MQNSESFGTTSFFDEKSTGQDALSHPDYSVYMYDSNIEEEKNSGSVEFWDAWSDEELKENQIRQRTMQDDLYFTPKTIVSDFETQTKVEYMINSWEELSARLDLSWTENKDYKIIQSEQELVEAIKTMKRHKYLALDTETTGLNIFNLKEGNPIKDRIVGCSISWKKDQGIYIPFRHLKFKNMNLGRTLRALKPVLESKKLILHNAIFDYKVFYDLGIRINVAVDTMSLLFHIDTMVAKGGKALKDNIKKIFGIDTLDLETMTGNSRYAAKFDTLDFNTCRVYGCADTDFALSLFLYLLPFLDKRSYKGFIQDMEILPILAEMEYTGRRIDMNKIPYFNEINNSDIRTLKDLAYKYVGTYINRKNGIDEVGQYLFNFNSADDLNNVLYEILGIIPLSYSEKTGKPETNSLTFKTLLSETTEEVDPVLAKLMSSDMLSGFAELGEKYNKDYGDDKYLLKWKKISICKYPFVFILKEIRARIKLKTSYFGKLMNPNYEGKYFTNVSLTAAETHRIIDPAQTIPAFLKELCIPTENHYMNDSDYAQVEARVFTSKAHMTELIDRLALPWADYHRESGSKIFGKKPEDISKEERSNLKVVNFGLPFKMAAKGLVGFKYGIIADKELEKQKIQEMQLLVDAWNVANAPVANMLNDYRRQAVTICKEDKVLSYFKGRKIGKIYNAEGMARVFDLEGVVDNEGNIIDNNKAERIYRQAGNFPIQSYAAYLYRKGVIDMHKQLESDGLLYIKVKDDTKPLGYHFEHMVDIIGTVHDESLFNIDSRVNPYYIIEVIATKCMIFIEGEAPYYMGISFAHDWHEGHSGDVEMPVAYVFDVLKEKRKEAKEQGLDRIPIFRENLEDPRNEILAGIKKFEEKQIADELINLNSDLTTLGGEISVSDTLNNFTNYTLKGQVFGVKLTDGIKAQLKEIAAGSSQGKDIYNIVGAMIQTYFKVYNVSEIKVKFEGKEVLVRRSYE